MITSEQRLRDAGYSYDERTDIWSNFKAGKAISGITVQRNTEPWIVTWIAQSMTPPTN